jgi:hypothetical protein
MTTLLRKAALPVLLATIWISISEFVRNEVLLKSFWVEHYGDLGMVFPSEPINGAIWGLWSLLFATAIYVVSRRFSLFQTAALTWFVGFVLMWVVLWNMNVLPPGILVYAIPLSILETFLAAFIIDKFAGSSG